MPFALIWLVYWIEVVAATFCALVRGFAVSIRGSSEAVRSECFSLLID